MLAALDALIDHGKGGQTAIALKQAAALMLRLGIDEAGENTAAFDELMATIAMNLDDECVLVLGPELKGLPGMLTAFTGTVLSRYHEIVRRGEPAVLLTDLPIAGGAASAAALVAHPSQPAGPERRAAPRDPDADLSHPLTLARRASPEQLEQIARLPALPEQLTSMIAARGHMPAILAALANAGASFGRATLATLAELSATDRELRIAMVARADLPGDAVDRLWPLMGREARVRAAMAGTLVSVEAARHALMESERLAIRAAEEGRRWRPLDVLRSAAADPHARQDVLCELADQGRAAELAALTAAESGIAFGVAFAMLCARLDHPAAIAVRAIGGGERAFQAVLGMRRERMLSRSHGDVVAAFERLDVDEARLLARIIDEKAAPPAVDEAAPSGRPSLALVS